MVEIGQPIPSFEAQATGDKIITQDDFRGHWTVLYFYPKDNTPGCTKEGEGFRDHYAEFQALNCEIYGCSRDSLKSHENFKAKYQFPFDLISDPNETLCRLFDVIKLKKNYGREYMGIERSTFLIDPDLILRYEWRKVRVPGHVEAVLEKLKELQAGAE
ncbi:peroxiredoxin Q/BCP [Sulfurivirga caldicuralii]|uniref:thioredoxin-dependent peroxiredoxin n=1 Tax=Sulfurivirga caldicuralii TaxID=364032 RepID=A0A1N6F6Z0_9GAMM|nr:peroxiredoxin [Sulfurivirga caldicuralii]SIN91030.1 peroxiredoxin Q/BCP [Sulfurivirga caldicuralii]